jgi:hypothetical protein
MTAFGAAGAVVRDADGVRLVFDRVWDAPIRDVWPALTDPDRLDACHPPHRLAVTTGGAGQRWPLDLTLTARGDDVTALRFVHRLTARDDVPSTGVGWHYYLDRLDGVLRGVPPTDAWDDYLLALADRYPAPADPDHQA